MHFYWASDTDDIGEGEGCVSWSAIYHFIRFFGGRSFVDISVD